ncbi:MAG TPA: hypothetical protein K8W02_11240 [Mediterranea massiliensis]|uniref:Lipoprotein n=1 Tax=Mediterranea massiliensis TaxID=1841865 RepID=A0A921LEX5_9BACT|nr:hypothetical protein [Mediterranea massiliensis]HJF92937.1 hypothetical protein [Mediterranea massiliensis]
MKKKFLFSSLFVAAAMVGCTNEDFVGQGQNDGLGVDRQVINVSFGVEEPQTKMVGEGDFIYYTTDDKIGAVLVDHTQKEPYTIVDTHVGNNKFNYIANKKKFETDGTMVVGSWLFYAQYDSRMTTSRNGVVYDFPQVQTYAEDLSEIAKIDFRTSPVVNLVGQEDGHFDSFNLPLVSVYSYAEVRLEFPQPVDVQKLVIRPTADDLQTSVPFGKQYTIKNTNVPVADLPNKSPLVTDQYVLDQAQLKMNNKGAYSSSMVFKDYSVKGSEDQDIIALNCLEDETEATTFVGRIALPAGKYSNIAIYAYTNKGIYKYNVKNASAEATNETIKGAQKDFYLRRGYIVQMNKIDRAIAAADYLKVKDTDKKTYAELEKDTETSGTVVISTEDLVAVVKAIDEAKDVKIRVLGDETVLNQAVMEALTERREKLGAGVQLVFIDDINIEGNASSDEPLVLHDVTFNSDAVLTSGYATSGREVYAKNTLTVGKSAGLNINEAYLNSDYSYMNVVNEGSLTISAVSTGSQEQKTAISAQLTNKGILAVTENAVVSIQKVVNSGIFTNDGQLSIYNLENNIDAKFVNNTEVSLNDKNGFNNGTIENNAAFNITRDFDNNGTIQNNKGGILLVKGAQGAIFTTTGNIYNSGDMYCHEGANMIYNTGKIYAKKGSTTYITRNSEYDESETATNVNVMGEIFCESRNEDVSVTTTNYKGYISFNVGAETTKLEKATGDKFNKVYLNGNCSLAHIDVSYVVVEGEANVTLATDKDYQEFTFNADATLNSKADYKNSIAKLIVAKDVRVKVPTENAIGVYDVAKTTSKSTAAIDNKGTILVGGNFWSKLNINETTGEGTFASGDGQTTAFHWGSLWE